MPLVRRGEARLVPLIAQHMARSSGASGALMDGLDAAKTMQDVANVVATVLGDHDPHPTPVVERKAPPLLHQDVISLNQGRALQRLAGTWVIIRPSTQCFASLE
ncbi:MAG: hypothetical protein J0653_05990, partial [Deltaproteobacteria bacterium]|nr:hypothetical protein [Deltaproteobacteria bacterium]